MRLNKINIYIELMYILIHSTMENKINLLQYIIQIYGFKSLTDYDYKLFNYKFDGQKERELIEKIYTHSIKIKNIFSIDIDINNTDRAIKLLRDLFDICGIKYIVSRNSKSTFTKLSPVGTEAEALVGNFIFDIENEKRFDNKYYIIDGKEAQYAEELIKITEKPKYDPKNDMYELYVPHYGDMISDILFMINISDSDISNFNFDHIKQNINICLEYNGSTINLQITKVFMCTNKLYLVISPKKWIFLHPLKYLKFIILDKKINTLFTKFSIYVNYIYLQFDIRRNILLLPSNFDNPSEIYDKYINDTLIQSNIKSNIHEQQLEYKNLKNITANLGELNLGYLRAIYLSQKPSHVRLTIGGVERFDISENLINYYKNLHETPDNYYILPLENYNKKMSFLYTNSQELDIILNITFEKETNCNILFDTYNEYFGNSYDLKIKEYLKKNYTDHIILIAPGTIDYKYELSTVEYSDLLICTHFMHDEICPPNYRLVESKTKKIDSEIFRVSEYKRVSSRKKNDNFNFPPHCFVLVHKK